MTSINAYGKLGARTDIDSYLYLGDPGERWEIYTVLEDSPTFWGGEGSQRWEAAAAELDDAHDTAATARDIGPATQCCGTSIVDGQVETASQCCGTDAVDKQAEASARA